MIETENIINDRYGNFHTHANLTQALNSIINRHYVSLQSSKGDSINPLPEFVSEAIHNICKSLAGTVNGQTFNPETWKEISRYSSLTAGILEQAIKAESEARVKAEAEKAVADANIVEEAVYSGEVVQDTETSEPTIDN